MLEILLIFLLVMMTAITVSLLTLLFVTSGTIENNKGKWHWSWELVLLDLQKISRLLGISRQATVSADSSVYTSAVWDGHLPLL